MTRDFNEWLGNLRGTIAGWTYYTDFKKIYENVDKIKIELNLLNSLIGSKNIEREFVELLDKYPEVLKVIPILLAVRKKEIATNDSKGLRTYNFDKKNYSSAEYAVFMRQTGLFDLIENHIVKDLQDYVKGVEVGLDSNARKNRTGTNMENLVEEHLQELGYIKDVTYFSQMRTSELEEKFNIKLSDIGGAEKAEKAFDFVVSGKHTISAIEVNFYTGGGSKLNETARSYKTLALESKNVENFRFIWITDGMGWFDAKKNLQETFLVHEYVFNLNDLSAGDLRDLLEK